MAGGVNGNFPQGGRSEVWDDGVVIIVIHLVTLPVARR